MIVVELLLPALAALALFGYVGFVPAHALLPRVLGGLRWAALPWAGYAAFVVLAQFTTQAGLDMAQTAVLALALATLANGLYAVRRRAGPSDPLPWARAGVAVGVLTGGVFVLGIAPILSYGYHTIIGENWDGEIYLALGAYLRDVAQVHLTAAPANPLLRELVTPPYSGRTHGFSYAQAAAGALTGLPSLVTLSPLLALLHALALPAGYFFFRTAWGWSARPAVAATAAWGLSPFLLWITYNTFGMQVPSLGLLPLAVAATLLALRDPRPRLAGFAALIAAALAVTYHPALTAWLALAGPGGLVLLVAAGRRWWRVALAGAGVGLGTLALSAVAQWLSLGGFLAQYAEQTAGLGLETFTAPTDALGLSLSFHTLLTAGPGQPLLARLAQGYGLLVALGGLACFALAATWLAVLLRRPRREALLAAATLGGAVVYLLLFRWPLDYVYGWFKAQSFVAFVLVGAVVGGAARLAPAAGHRRLGRWLAPALIAGLPAAALTFTLALVLWQYHTPVRYSAEMIESGQVSILVRPGDSVLVSGSRLMPGRLFDGLLAYFLRDTQLYGTFATAYTNWDAARPDGVYTWTVAPAREPPALYGVAPADRAWSNALLALYRAPPDLIYHQTWERKGDYPQSTAGAPLTWQVTPDRVQVDGAPLPEPPPTGAAPPPDAVMAPRRLDLGVAVFTTTTLAVRIAPSAGLSRDARLSLAPGLQQVSLPLAALATVTLQPAPGADPLAVRWASLHTAADVAAPATVAAPLPGVLLLHIQSVAAGAAVETRIDRVDTRPPAKQPDRVVLDVYRSGGNGAEPDHFGYWAFPLAGPTTSIRVPLAGGAAAPAPLQLARGSAQTGRFTASLTFYAGPTPLDTVTDIYTFQAHRAVDGALVVDHVVLRALPLLFY